MNNYSTHVPPKQSTQLWQGSQSSKFKVGRFHQNHPTDQLDTLMISAKSTQFQNTGKKQFLSQRHETNQVEQKSHIRIFQNKYKRSTVFDQQDLTKLIKVPFTSSKEKRTNIQHQINQKYNYSTIGTSKIKALQAGLKKTGIYRNFYNSQAQSLQTLQAYQ